MTVAQPICLRRPVLGAWCLRARVARAVIDGAANRFPIRLRYPDGTEVGAGRADGPIAEVVRPTAMYERLAHHPKIGLGEAYMAGDWKAAPGTDLAQFLMPFASRITEIVPPVLLRLRGAVEQRIPHTHRNTVDGSRANIAHHYDLSNDLFAAFLDPTLSYSSARFDPSRPRSEQDLEQAQHRKIDAALDAARVAEGSRVLEIGSGWGSLAIAAAQRGARVTTITLSAEQQVLARERIAAAGLSHRVDVVLQDYREVTGTYDAIVSVEMIEAVGEEYWPTYFQTLEKRLAPGGSICIQAILMDHHRYLATRNSFGWIQKYIFPGGLIPSLTAIREVTRRHTGLEVASSEHFGPDYAETLHRWRATFTANWAQINGHGFDETFRRMWEFYLAYCEAGFATGYLDVAQVRLTKAAT